MTAYAQLTVTSPGPCLTSGARRRSRRPQPDHSDPRPLNPSFQTETARHRRCAVRFRHAYTTFHLLRLHKSDGSLRK